MKAIVYTVWAGLFLATGIALFNIAFEVEALEQRLAEINAEILHEQETLRVLDAEWAYLNRPDRLELLSGQLLPHLQEPAVDQIADFEAIPNPLELPPPAPVAESEPVTEAIVEAEDLQSLVTRALSQKGQTE